MGRRERRTARRRTEPIRTPVGSGLAELLPDPDRPRAWTLLVDGAPQSHVDLDDPGHLDFEYQRRLGHIVDVAARPGRPLRVLHLGGGACTMARYVAFTRPRSQQQVFESDAALVALVRDRLPLQPSWHVRIRTGDARASLARVQQGWADLVIVDAFAEARVPAHLTTVEFLTAVRDVLAPDGLYTANLADGPPLGYLRSQVATVRAVFPQACLIADPAVLRGRRFGNAVLLAGHRDLPLVELSRLVAGDPFAGRVEHGRDLDLFTGGAARVTDAGAVPSPRPPESAFRGG